MHMADALLSPAVGGTMYAVSAGAIGYAAHKIQKEGLAEEKLPLMAVSGSFVFAAQMINFTIPATGSSGHICGGILLAGLLGGEPAILSLAAVLIIQCLLFADGGLLALGANIFNMGIIPCLIVYPLLMRPFLKKGISAKRITVISVLSCIIGLQLGAFGVVLETLASGVTELPFSTFVSLMQPIHLAIGLVEGLITAGVLSYVYRMRPEILESAATKEKLPVRVSIGRTVVTLAVLAALVGGGLSLYASSKPDGLEWAMEHTAGTSELEREGGIYEKAAGIQERTSLLPDYDFAAGEGTGTTASGLIGAAVTAALAAGAGAVLTFTKKKHSRRR